MKKGSLYIFTLLYVLIGAAILLSPSSVVFAQDDSVEEIFWGDDEEEDLDVDFEFSEDDEFSGDDEGDLENFDFDDDEFSDDEFSDDEFSDDEFSDDFSEDFSEPEEDIGEAADRLGYTLNISGASPGFVNHQLQTYNSNVDFRVSVELPMALQIAGIRFRLGAEAGTFSFKNYMPKGGVFSGVHINGLVSFPAGPGQVKLGAGLFGSGVGFVAENSYGMSIGSTVELRLGIRSNTALNVVDDKNNTLGTASWMDGILMLGVSL
ncbi:MAG: hypothetical protein CMG58_03350 [Candidatus Marinimicrobia bacterium]|nr:hypothetical protein [Candidatus Neomarinimicrobiota bacterium]